eukprot:1348489-Pyramimonas_sp.AAC.1
MGCARFPRCVEWQVALGAVEEAKDQAGLQSAGTGSGRPVEFALSKLEWNPPRRRTHQSKETAALQLAARWLKHGRHTWQLFCHRVQNLVASNVVCGDATTQTTQPLQIAGELLRFYSKVRRSPLMPLLPDDFLAFLKREIE